MKTFFVVAFVVCGLLDALAALFVLSRRPAERPLQLPRVLGAGLAVALLSLLEAAVLLPLGLHAFGLMHLAWIVLAYVVPLCGLAVLVGHARGRRASAGALGIAALALLAIPVAITAQCITPFDLRLETATVILPAARAGQQPIRVGVLADVQSTSVGPHERAAVARLMAEQPDLILVPGDLYQGPAEFFERELPAFQALLRQLQAPGGVWVVPGNTDHQAGLARLVEGGGARLLRDELVRVQVGDRSVEILGLDERAHEGLAVWRARAPGLATFARRPGDETIRIVLAHRPRAVMQLPPDSRIDLVVAGHTHGGQVALPGIGPLLTLSPLPRFIGAGGLHEFDGNALYVSRGVGLERLNAPRIRLGVPPEVSILTFRDAGGPLP